MRGELRLVIDRAYSELWEPLLEHDACPDNLFGEVYVALAGHLVEPPPDFEQQEDGSVRNRTETLASRQAIANNDAKKAKDLVSVLGPDDFGSESDALKAVQDVHEALADVAGDDFACRHRQQLRSFVAKYSLRYYVDQVGRFWMTFPGITAVIFKQLRVAANANPHMSQELDAFEQALAECLGDPAEVRIKTAIQKQVNVLEAIGTQHPGVTGNTLGTMLDQVGSFPHSCLPGVGKALYKFACDYPGIRHAGTYDAALRPLDLRDLVGVALSLVGLATYFTDGFEKSVKEAIVSASFGADDEADAPWVPLPGGVA